MRKIILFFVFISCFLLISTSFVTAVNVKNVRDEISEKINEKYQSFLNGGIIDWLINLILSIIELIKRPFEKLKEKEVKE